MPASEKRIAANRANSMKSTGPRTPEGKERSKMNAVTHGLTAQSSVLPGEDGGQLEELSAALMRELKPSGMVQRLIAERIVSLTWKLRRVARAEEVVARQMDESAASTWEEQAAVRASTGGLVFQGLGPRPGVRSGAAILADSFPAGKRSGDDGRMLQLTQYELKLDAALRGAIRELRAIQKEQRQREDAGDGDGETAGETAPGENEANKVAGVAEGGPAGGEGTDDARPDLKSEVSDSGSDGAKAATSAGEKTNPTPPPGAADQPPAATGFPGESSAPAPRTSSSPHPGPRR